jgi:tetratricopeptide (TPR) repeat protein
VKNSPMAMMANRFVLFFVVTGLLVSAGCGTSSGIKREQIAEAQYKLGISDLNNGQLQQAFVKFQKALESNPKYRDAHYALGHLYFLRNQLDEAQNEFIKTIKLDPDFAEAHNYLGKVYEQKGEWELAIEEYKKALENLQYKTPHFARYNLGVALMNLNDHEGALAEFDKAIRIDPSFIGAYQAKGQAYSQLNRYSEAIKAYQQALNLNPNNPAVHFSLGVAYFKTDLHQEAKEAFEKVIELVPEGELAKSSKPYLDRLQ